MKVVFFHFVKDIYVHFLKNNFVTVFQEGLNQREYQEKPSSFGWPV